MPNFVAFIEGGKKGGWVREGCATESIEGFIEDLAFSQSYDLAPSQSHPLLLNWIVTQRKTEKERKLSDGRRREELGEASNHTTARKPGSL